MLDTVYNFIYYDCLGLRNCNFFSNSRGIILLLIFHVYNNGSNNFLSAQASYLWSSAVVAGTVIVLRGASQTLARSGQNLAVCLPAILKHVSYSPHT
ncbi:hypothetical protein EON63_08580 [archaeon]|nr:MAG: hypothetical protein EON63_08580 [archaeon]